MAHHPNQRPVVKDICASDRYKQLQEELLDIIPKL